jgi:hypothetical protein
LASQLKEPRQKKILEGMAQSWEAVARQRAKQLAKSASSKARRKSKVVMSALGQKQTSRHHLGYVRFTPESGHR